MIRFARGNTHWIRLFDDYLLSHLHILDGLSEKPKSYLSV